MQEETQNATLEDLRERYGDYPVWAAIQQAYNTGYTEGFEEAAKSSDAWYILDKNGEQVHIGDRVMGIGSEPLRVAGLCRDCVGVIFNNVSCKHSPQEWWSRPSFAKAKPDSWEKLGTDIVRGLKNGLLNEMLHSEIDNYVAKFISRANNLGGMR